MSVTGSFRGAEGTSLFCQRWEADSPRATLVIVHGLSEHSGRYEKTADYFTGHGYSVYGFDLRGHGRSGGRRVHAESLEQLLEDIDLFLGTIPAGVKGPLFLVGHSFGGQLVLNFAARRPERLSRIRGLIVSSPNLRIKVRLPWYKEVSASLLSRVSPTFQLINEVLPSDLSHDPEVVRAYKKDPLVERKISCRLGHLLLKNQEGIMEMADRIRIPCLLMHGRADRICSPEATREFFEKIPVEDKTLKVYEGFYHELFNEIGKEQVYHDIVRWMEKHL